MLFLATNQQCQSTVDNDGDNKWDFPDSCLSSFCRCGRKLPCGVNLNSSSLCARLSYRSAIQSLSSEQVNSIVSRRVASGSNYRAAGMSAGPRLGACRWNGWERWEWCPSWWWCSIYEGVAAWSTRQPRPCHSATYGKQSPPSVRFNRIS